jgi:hypothetical protein
MEDLIFKFGSRLTGFGGDPGNRLCFDGKIMSVQAV